MSMRANASSLRIRTSVALTLGIVVLGSFGAAPRVHAQASLSSLFGIVDQQKIVASYNKRADLERKIQDIQTRLSIQFKTESASDMLSPDKQQQLAVLLGKPTPSDADRSAITVLQAESIHDASELAALQQKQNPTDIDKARLTQLTNQQQAAHQALQQMGDSYTDQIKSQADVINTQLMDTIKLAIAAVAKEHNLAVVFDSTVAIYAANDITDDVTKHLNK